MTASQGTGTAVFFPDLGGNVLYAKAVVGALGDAIGTVGVRLDSTASQNLASISVGRLADHFATAVAGAELQPPVYFAGYSFAGFLAYETARRLDQMGAAPARLWLLDTSIYRRLVRWPALRYPASELPLIARHLAANWRRIILRQPSADFLQSYGHVRINLSRHPKGYHEVLRAMYRALETYRPDRWPNGRATVFRATGARVTPRDLGWSKLIGGDLCVKNFAGNHTSIVNDGDVAAIVAAHMRLEIAHRAEDT